MSTYELQILLVFGIHALILNHDLIWMMAQ